MIINMLKEFSDNYNWVGATAARKTIETMNKNQNEMKNIISEMKNTLGRIKIWLDEAEKWLSELEDKVEINNQAEQKLNKD